METSSVRLTIFDSEIRYTVAELKLQAVVWTMTKCRMYLLGLPHFELLIDHNLLVFILKYHTLDGIQLPRLLRLKEKSKKKRTIRFRHHLAQGQRKYPPERFVSCSRRRADACRHGH